MPFAKVAAVSALMALLGLAGCRSYPDYMNDFRFPIEAGNIERGRQAFVAHGCNRCHVVDGVQLPRPANAPLTVELGGELMFAKTYGDLVTSIINPGFDLSDRYLGQLDSEQRRNLHTSPMSVSPDMKVSELIDIVAFLNSRYSLLPGYTEYVY